MSRFILKRFTESHIVIRLSNPVLGLFLGINARFMSLLDEGETKSPVIILHEEGTIPLFRDGLDGVQALNAKGELIAGTNDPFGSRSSEDGRLECLGDWGKPTNLSVLKVPEIILMNEADFGDEVFVNLHV